MVQPRRFFSSLQLCRFLIIFILNRFWSTDHPREINPFDPDFLDLISSKIQWLHMESLGSKGLYKQYNLDTFYLHNLRPICRHIKRISVKSLYRMSLMFRRRTLRLISGVIRLLSVPSGEQASGRRWDCSGLDHVVRRCFGTKWYGRSAGGTEYPRWWQRQVGRLSSFARFFKLDKYAMLAVLPWQAAWQVILISLKSS